MLKILKLSVLRKVLSIIEAHRVHYKQIQNGLLIGSIEWKYYQSKLNALTDIEMAIIDEYKLKTN